MAGPRTKFLEVSFRLFLLIRFWILVRNVDVWKVIRTLYVHTYWLNVLPMSPKLFLSYPHREEYREINLATLFLWLVLLKLLCNQLKIFVNLTFSQKVWLFVLFWFTGFAELRVLQVQLHCSKKEVTFWLCCGKNVKFLKSIICD